MIHKNMEFLINPSWVWWVFTLILVISCTLAFKAAIATSKEGVEEARHYFIVGCVILGLAFLFFSFWIDSRTQFDTIEKIASITNNEMVQESRSLNCDESFDFTPLRGYFSIRSMDGLYSHKIHMSKM